MAQQSRIVLAATALRLLLGWYMFIDGLQILLTPGWSASGFLLGAQSFPAFYAWFALPMNSWWVDPLNSWGITLIGAALLLGVGVRFASWAGALMMLLYYFPHYALPVVPHGYVVEEHIIYAAAFVLFAVLPAAGEFGLAKYLRRTFLGRIPVVGALL
ncbi:MAG: DoxX family membrane protein [Patescibacteria group bacterium]|nr:DoxX family membrane protein [Patescibacteria group bacterium]MDE1966041.1 DoxX family membrane protein [Patescibacteria group bacterium]